MSVTSRASGGVAVLPKHISVLIVNHLLHHRVTGPNLCHHGGRLSACEIEAVQILSLSAPGLKVRSRSRLMAITGSLARLLCTTAWLLLLGCNHRLLPRPILWHAAVRRCHLCCSSRKKKHRVSCRTETLTLECLRCLQSSSSHLPFFIFVFFHDACRMNLWSSPRICSSCKPAARIYQLELGPHYQSRNFNSSQMHADWLSLCQCVHCAVPKTMLKTEEIGRLNRSGYDPGSWPQGAAGRLHRGGDPRQS